MGSRSDTHGEHGGDRNSAPLSRGVLITSLLSHPKPSMPDRHEIIFFMALSAADDSSETSSGAVGIQDIVEKYLPAPLYRSSSFPILSTLRSAFSRCSSCRWRAP